MINYLAIASAAALFSAPVAATPGNSTLMKDVASAFKQADSNKDGQLSPDEYRDLRTNAFSKSEIGGYHAGPGTASTGMTADSFAMLDRDRNGSISAGEFNSIAAQAHSGARSQTTSTASPAMPAGNQQQGWNPDYVTVVYYLMRNPVDADALKGQPVTNLKGEKVGEVARIIRARGDGKTYAMIDIKGSPMYRPTSGQTRDEAGVPLEDLLWGTNNGALMLSGRGEEWLRDADAHVVENFEEVDRLYRAG